MSAAITHKLNIWKNKLLDVSKRNRLINYRVSPSSRSYLKILNPNIYELWNNFALKEKKFTFPLEEFKETERKSRFIIPDRDIGDSQITLRNLKNKTKLFAEEQGVNILYLAFGFLSWKEKENNDFLLSPLLLVPSLLSRKSIISPFVLSKSDDEIVVNPTLLYKLKNDFGINLPSEAEDNLELFFEKIYQIIVPIGWNIIPDVSLGLFSFNKISMYNDMLVNQDKIINHPIINALAGDSSSLKQDISFINGYDHDAASPDKVFSIVDADSSQMDAILLAKKGVSFVLQGPPGTGKSQTITNIIAESLAEGKKILFVSEKKAALDVVFKRLSEGGLGDFCLNLHNSKVQKKEVISELNKTRSKTAKNSYSQEDINKLGELSSIRSELNDYIKTLHKNIEPLGKTIFEVMGELSYLENVKDEDFKINDIRNTEGELFNKYRENLSRLSEAISAMKTDYHDNAWYGSTLSYFSHELSAKIKSVILKSLSYIKRIKNILEDIEKNLSLLIPKSLAEIERAEEILKIASFSPKIPINWIMEEENKELISEAYLCEEYQNIFLSGKIYLNEQLDYLQNYYLISDVSEYKNINSVSQIDKCINYFQRYIEKDSLFKFWNGISDKNILNTMINLASENIEEYNAIYTEIAGKYEKEIFTYDYNEMFFRFKSDYNSIFKFLKPAYHRDRKIIKKLSLSRDRKITDEEIFNLLQKLRRLDELDSLIKDKDNMMYEMFGYLYSGKKTNFNAIKKHLSLYMIICDLSETLKKMKKCAEYYENNDLKLKNFFEKLYCGFHTDWASIIKSIKWANDFKDKYFSLYGKGAASFENEGGGENYIKFIKNICDSDEKIKLCDNYANIIKESLSDFNSVFSKYEEIFSSPLIFRNMALAELENRLNRCGDNISSLEEWIYYNNAVCQCTKLGLGDYINIIDKHNIHYKDIVPIFEKRFYYLWLDSIYPEYPSVGNFRRAKHENNINRFKELDKYHFEISKSRISDILINCFPFAGYEEDNRILSRELSKKTRIMPVRTLFNKIPFLIMSLKPCLMMSPLSVSLFLESDKFDFDILIIDEASQLCTENAIGAVRRCRQVIIAGDRKQLPPANFFTKTSDADFEEEYNEEEQNDISIGESILDDAYLLPEKSLLWHYRSRNEDLIAFSNINLYGNKLITFPANTESRPNFGVEFIKVEGGYYDRGGKKGNIKEAEKTAELIFEHYKEFPDRSLGVIAFGEIQAAAIENALNKMRLKNQEYEGFFSEEGKEPFFVKSIENVQGDERDTIIFSVGYAKDSKGVMRMQFGPLSAKGGERRLNVAVTRAKYNIKLVSSIEAGDIDVKRVKEEGAKLLKKYIEFASKGDSSLNSVSGGMTDRNTLFEKSVYNFLKSEGYNITANVGLSEDPIDIAVNHPADEGRYILGIECDGPDYFRTRTVRERDRLRINMLSNMGWKIYRIWAADWIKNPISEKRRLIEAINGAISE